MSQRFVCGIRRFDKHRVEPMKGHESQRHSAECEDRLRQREAQDRALFGVPATPHTTPVLSGGIHPAPPSPLFCPITAPSASSASSAPSASSASTSHVPFPSPPPLYTPWRTPSASSSPSMVPKPG